MLYMSGGGIQIWNLGIVFMLMLGPLQALAKINQGALGVLRALRRVRESSLTPRPAFAPFAPSTAADTKATSTLLLQKLAYLACNLLTIGVGLWKCRSMGLLPVGTADWLPYETRGQVRRFLCPPLFAPANLPPPSHATFSRPNPDLRIRMHPSTTPVLLLAAPTS